MRRNKTLIGRTEPGVERCVVVGEDSPWRTALGDCGMSGEPLAPRRAEVLAEGHDERAGRRC